jgi:predicted ribosomally synthesized peptide with nif11-like leader
MSIESARCFTDRLKTDKQWRNKLSEAKDKQARLAMVEAEGFDFTESEMKEVSAGLSDEELAGVDGGIDDCPTDHECPRSDRGAQ